MQVRGAPGVYDVVAKFLGDGSYAPSSAVTGPITITKRATNLCIEALENAGDSECTPTAVRRFTQNTPYVVATLTGQPLPNQPSLILGEKEVRFTAVDQASGATYVASVVTDYAGRAFFDQQLPAGTYAIGAAFAGTEALLPTQSTPTQLTLLVNRAPVCDTQTNPATIGPLNKEFVTVTPIVVDPDGDTVQIQICASTKTSQWAGIQMVRFWRTAAQPRCAPKAATTATAACITFSSRRLTRTAPPVRAKQRRRP